MLDRRVHLFAVGRYRVADQTDAAERHDRPLERFVSLQPDDLLQILVNIARVVRGNGGDRLFVDVVDAAARAFFLHFLTQLVPKRLCALGRRR